MSKNIVICCDGTGNEVEKNLSNVLKLYRILKKDKQQVVFYDPGLGTFGNATAWQSMGQTKDKVFDAMTGSNLDQNVVRAYKFLINHYKAGDQIYMFGFSRGAYTVRVLAGFIHMIGFLRPEQENLCHYAFGAYKRASKKGNFEEAWRFERVLSTDRVPIKFIGVWDTVSSIVVPKFPSLDQQTLAYTATNPSVEVFRHAISIEEIRSMFRLNQWTQPQTYNPNPFNKAEDKDQDIKQVWFSGNHSDVGGGFPEEESGLAKITLRWVIEEAKEAGLKINTAMFNHLVLGKKRKGSKRVYVEPDHMAPLHTDMPWYYWILEGVPKKVKYREWKKRDKELFGWYLPMAEPRAIPEGALIHKSVIDRMNQVADYMPVNLPEKYEICE